MWYVYVLKSESDGRFYVGSTSDLKRRVSEHQQGKCISTRNRLPVELEAYIAVKDQETARNLEKYLKSGSGVATLRKRLVPVDGKES